MILKAGNSTNDTLSNVPIAGLLFEVEKNVNVIFPEGVGAADKSKIIVCLPVVARCAVV